MEPRIHLIDPAANPLESLLAHLVAHGVGQGLDRGGASYGVPVEVEQRVKLGQGESAVAPEDGHTRGAQLAAPEVVVLGG
jgi:hypothetical protein